MTLKMHTCRFAEMNKTKMQARVDTRYTGAKTTVKTNYKLGFLPKRKEKVLLGQQTTMPHVANSSIFLEREGHPRTAD